MLRPHLEVHSSHEPKADCCFFLGYSDDHKGFRCFSLCRRRVFISRHVMSHLMKQLYMIHHLQCLNVKGRCHICCPPLLTLLPLHLRSLFGPFPRPVPLPAVLLQPSRISLLVHILLHLLMQEPGEQPLFWSWLLLSRFSSCFTYIRSPSFLFDGQVERKPINMTKFNR